MSTFSSVISNSKVLSIDLTSNMPIKHFILNEKKNFEHMHVCS